MTRTSEDNAFTVGVAVALGLALLALLWLTGCGSALSTAQRSTLVAGQAVSATEDAFVAGRTAYLDVLVREAVRTLPAPEQAQARHDYVTSHAEPVETAATAVTALAGAWRVVALAVLAWGEGTGDAPSWQRAVACLAAAAGNAIHALVEIGAHPPPLLESIAASGTGFAEQMCGAPAGGSAEGHAP